MRAGELQRDDRPGSPSGFGCPDCGGALFEIDEGEMVRYRCRVGHAWSPDSLLHEQTETLESALWTALRALEERVALSFELAERMDRRGSARSAERFRGQAEEAHRRAAVVRSALVHERMDEAGGASDVGQDRQVERGTRTDGARARQAAERPLTVDARLDEARSGD
jgi:two-component system chemotaxis response regulator CheB